MATIDHATQDRDTIIAWVEKRSGYAARVIGTHPDAEDDANADVEALRIGFPGYASEERLEPLSWDDFFADFAGTFYYYETEPDGTMSHRYRMD